MKKEKMRIATQKVQQKKKDDLSLKEKFDKSMADLKKYHKLMKEETKQAFDHDKQTRVYQKTFEKLNIKIELHETKLNYEGSSGVKTQLVILKKKIEKYKGMLDVSRKSLAKNKKLIEKAEKDMKKYTIAMKKKSGFIPGARKLITEHKKQMEQGLVKMKQHAGDKKTLQVEVRKHKTVLKERQAKTKGHQITLTEKVTKLKQLISEKNVTEIKIIQVEIQTTVIEMNSS